MQIEHYDKINAIKWIGIITMTIDHVGYYLFPHLIWLRIIGRIAFPCFLYTTIQATEQTRNFKRYLFQLIGAGIVTIPISLYSGTIFNVLFTLALVAISVKDKRFFVLALVLSYFCEYGIYGFLLGWAIYCMVSIHKVLGVLLFLGLQFFAGSSVQIFACLAIFLLLIDTYSPTKKMPKIIGYIYYPLHQLILLVIRFNL
ncbi:TraX family protein [Carnobacterium jeotgali]|nr:TraX family protein [Carnobacterium jeotgali]